MQAVMMVAGKSTRTYPLTLTRPKPLLPILNRAMIYSNLDQLVGCVDEVILIVGYCKEMIKDILGYEYRGMKITYQEQLEQKGTGHAVLQVKSLIKDRFIVMNGDDLFARVDIEKLLAYPYGLLAKKVPNPWMYGVMQTDENNCLTNFVEKPKEFVSDLVNIGCYIFEPEIFDALSDTKPSERGEIELPTAILALSHKEQVQVISIVGYWLPTGFPWDVLKTENYLFNNFEINNDIKGIVESNVEIQGQVQIGINSVIESGVKIIGPVIIGDNCKIAAGSIIGPCTTIGNNSIIENECTINNSTVFTKVKIGANTNIQHSVIGENVIIEKGCRIISNDNTGETVKSLVKEKLADTQLLNFGAALADNVHLGANTTIMPGCKLWPGVTTAAGDRIEGDIEN